MNRLIDAQELIDALEAEKRECYQMNHFIAAQAFMRAIECVVDAPTVEQKKGQFVDVAISTNHGTVNLRKCSECGYVAAMSLWNFCPNCGTDMRGTEDEQQNDLP